MSTQIKIAHLSDCHIGFGKAAFSFAGEDVLRSFQLAIDGIQNWADVLIISGDLFDSIRLDVNGLRFVADQLRRLTCPTIIIGGNHDTPATKGVESPLSMLAELHPALNVVEYEYRVLSFPEFDVHAIPARFLSYWVDPIEPERPSILVVHGVHPYSPQKPPRSAWEIPTLYDPKKFLYVALGDLHEMHSVPTAYPPREYYAGAPTFCSTNPWSESSSKGWLKVIVTPNHPGGSPSVEFVPIPQRPWTTVAVDIDLDVDPKLELEKVLSQLDNPLQLKPAVRLVLSGSDINKLTKFQNELQRQQFPVVRLQIERRYRRKRPDSIEGSRVTQVLKRWLDYVHANKGNLPQDITLDEVVRRGIEAMFAVSEEQDPLQAAMKTLLEYEEPLDPNDPFVAKVAQLEGTYNPFAETNLNKNG